MGVSPVQLSGADGSADMRTIVDMYEFGDVESGFPPDLGAALFGACVMESVVFVPLQPGKQMFCLS